MGKAGDREKEMEEGVVVQRVAALRVVVSWVEALMVVVTEVVTVRVEVCTVDPSRLCLR